MLTIPRIVDFTFRLVVLTLALMVGVAFLLAAGSHRANAAELQTLSVVNSDTLKAGDIFTGLNKDQADYVLGTPPQPGKDMVLDAHVLTRIAQTIDLNWQPKSITDQVVVRRAATIVSADDIRATLNTDLIAQGFDGKFNISFTDASGPQIILPQDQPETAAIKSIRFNTDRDWFEAVLVAPSADHPVKEMTVTGKIQRLVSIPVLKNTMRSGDVISAADISTIDVPSEDVQGGMILKADALTGMTPDRVVLAGKPVIDSDIRRPQIIGRGDFITLVYANGPLTLMTKGKSMQNAAKGDLVSVINISSSRTLQGVATGDHEVTVTE